MLAFAWGPHQMVIAPGKRAKSFNEKLQRTGHGGRLFEVEVTRAGKKPWAASKDTYRAIYNLL